MIVEENLFTSSEKKFAVELDVFSGPFEVLLSLISKRKLDITEVSLAEVTDEFLAFIASQDDLDLSYSSEFLVVAATLLDLKAARLLPHDENTEEDFEILEARDLLFAKLLQYRAFKEVAADISLRFATQSLATARSVALEPQFCKILPELIFSTTPEELAHFAAVALSPKKTEISFDHLHSPLVPVSSQVDYLRERLTLGDRVSFTQLCADTKHPPMIVSRFLAILELLRLKEIRIEQASPTDALILLRVEPDDNEPLKRGKE